MKLIPTKNYILNYIVRTKQMHRIISRRYCVHGYDDLNNKKLFKSRLCLFAKYPILASAEFRWRGRVQGFSFHRFKITRIFHHTTEHLRIPFENLNDKLSFTLLQINHCTLSIVIIVFFSSFTEIVQQVLTTVWKFKFFCLKPILKLLMNV